MIITNPILRGFNPDPSICRVGDDFYLSVSTFEWFPGIQIWHSRDLENWRMIARPLDSARLLDMTGMQTSAGVWAPCLTWVDETFFLVFTPVTQWRGADGKDAGAFKDTPNYVTTAKSINGPWSDPIYLNASGFDGSFFHDPDGTSWFLNMEWDYRCRRTHFTGVLLQQFDRSLMQLTGPITKIFSGTPLDRTEAPHIYLKDDWYYLMVAEGGTGYEHAVTVARSRALAGPYQVHPDNPVISSLADRTGDVDRINQMHRDVRLGKSPDESQAPVGFYERPQRAGHASICQLDEEEWALVHLSSRPLRGTADCPLGRETSIQRLIWDTDGWPRVTGPDGMPAPMAPAVARFSWEPGAVTSDTDHTDDPLALWNTTTTIDDDFDGPRIHDAFRYLRRHPGDDVDSKTRPGYLRLKGWESPLSVHRQSVVAVAVGAFRYRAEAVVDFQTESFQQMAGLLVRYDERNQYYLRIAADEESGGPGLNALVFAAGAFTIALDHDLPLPKGEITLGLTVEGREGQFYWYPAEDRPADGPTGVTARPGVPAHATALGGILDMAQLSDQAAWPEGFTGTFVGMTCNDMTGRANHADFNRFTYTEYPELPSEETP